jgi:hypothetical protein
MESPTKVNINCYNLYHDLHFHSGIKATGRKAKWTAAGLFKLENGKITL